MEADIQIGSSVAALTFNGETLESASPEYLDATLKFGGLTAAKRVYAASGFGDLATFFSDMALDWRGWKGERSWVSLEGDLAIHARHAYGHVQLRVVLRSDGPGWGDDGWTATAALTLEPGEQLSGIASRLEDMARGTWHG